MLSSTTDSRVLPLVWRLLVLFLAFVPVGRAATAKCVSGWEWVSLLRFRVTRHPLLIHLLLSVPIFCHPSCDDSRTTRRNKAHVKSLGTYKGRA